MRQNVMTKRKSTSAQQLIILNIFNQVLPIRGRRQRKAANVSLTFNEICSNRKTSLEVAVTLGYPAKNICRRLTRTNREQTSLSDFIRHRRVSRYRSFGPDRHINDVNTNTSSAITAARSDYFDTTSKISSKKIQRSVYKII